MKFRMFGTLRWCIAFILVAVLVFGGLAWVTVASLRVEAAQLEASARADRSNQERLALWRLDSFMLPAMGLENNRPFAHYTALHAPFPAWDADQESLAPGSVRLPSPLLSADMPPWMLLHFQIDPDRGWESPQVIPAELSDRLRNAPFHLSLTNVSPQRERMLAELQARVPAEQALSILSTREHLDPDDGFVVPVPLADEPAIPKPQGYLPGEPEPGQYRLGLPTNASADAIASIACERKSVLATNPGSGRMNLLSVPTTPEVPAKPKGAARFTGSDPSSAMGAGGSATMGPGGFGGGQSPTPGPPAILPSPIPSQLPGGTGGPGGGAGLGSASGLSQSGAPPLQTAQLPPLQPAVVQPRGQSQSPSKTNDIQEQAEREYAARMKATQRSMETRGGFENSSQQLGKSVANITPQGVNNDKTQQPPAPTSSPSPRAPQPPGMPQNRDLLREKAAYFNDPKAESSDGSNNYKRLDEMAKKASLEKERLFFDRWPFRSAGTNPPQVANGAVLGPNPTTPADTRRGSLPAGAMPPGAPKPDETFDKQSQFNQDADRVAMARKLSSEYAMVTAPAARKTPPTVQRVAVHLGPLRPQWLTAADGSQLLVLIRSARLENKTVYQGVLLDWPELRRVLSEQVADLFPGPSLDPVQVNPAASPERTMTTLPVHLDPGPPLDTPSAGWSPLRIGLLLAWAAAFLALAAVGIGGRALLDLSERRIRFVSAVTHELRTPLTSLRLYLDLLTSGMIEDETKQKEYLSTLATESERLNRLIENVLDFARLEKRSVQTAIHPTRVSEMLEQVRMTWSDRCSADGKELVVISTLPDEQQVSTDIRIAIQVLGNLVDNARKYSRDADDQRIWVWAKPSARGRVVFEVEDRGPGVPTTERAGIFRPFRRGTAADTQAGGAGLGLALAKHWADLLNGTLSYRPADGGVGACFRLELPSS